MTETFTVYCSYCDKTTIIAGTYPIAADVCGHCGKSQNITSVRVNLPPESAQGEVTTTYFPTADQLQAAPIPATDYTRVIYDTDGVQHVAGCALAKDTTAHDPNTNYDLCPICYPVPESDDRWREKVVARINDRLDATCARHPGAWTIVDRGGMGYDVKPLDSGIRGQFNDFKDAEFVANAADDMRALLSMLNGANHNLIEANRTIAALEQEVERLKAILTALQPKE